MKIKNNQVATDMTIKELCLLPNRDPFGTPRLIVEQALNDTTHAITWTDLHDFLNFGSVGIDIFSILRSDGRLDDEKYKFAIGAMEFIKSRSLQAPHGSFIQAWQSIWDVMWNYYRLCFDNELIFRGQFNAAWPLKPTFFRNDQKGLSIGAMLRRATLTESFISSLRSQQSEYFFDEPNDRDLLGVAQHFGFATPLIDFSRSLGVAAFFATLDARHFQGDTNECGVIFFLRLDATRIAMTNPGKNAGFPLLELTDINPGAIEIIEPDMKDEDNRIRRQKALFIGGAEPLALHEFLIDRIFFWQQPGDVYEDPRSGIDQLTLLPERTQLSEIAESVKKTHNLTEKPTTINILADTCISERGIIGSSGSYLWSQIQKGDDFIEELHTVVEKSEGSEGWSFIIEVMTSHFNSLRSQMLTGQIPVGGGTGPVDNTLFTTIAKLNDWAGLNLTDFWAHILCNLDGGPGLTDGHLKKVFCPQIDNDRHGIAIATALYLSSWEHLRCVDGKKARNLSSEAKSVLIDIKRNSYSDELLRKRRGWEPLNSQQPQRLEK